MVSRRDRCRAAASRAFHLPRPHLRARHLLVSFSLSGTDGRGRPPSRSTLGGQTMRPSSNLPALIERYFTVRLMNERNVSANTIACYRDTFRQLFTFAQKKLRRQPSALTLDDLDAPFISAFLADLEAQRGVSVRTRNLRLTAIRSFFRFA